MSHTKKVIASIIYKDNKFLLAQRSKKDILYGKWEFPGGKLEPNETYEECLKRELNEEFGVIATIGNYFCSSYFEHKGQQYEMMAFFVDNIEGDFILREHHAIAWVPLHELSSYDVPEPDKPIIQALVDHVNSSRL